MVNQKTKGTSWTAIIIVLIFCWPVGIYLIYKKLNSDKTAAIKNGRVMSVFGWILLSLGIIYFLMMITGNKDMIGAFIIFGGSGAALLIVSKRRTKNASKYKKYISLIANKNVTSIDNIASAIPINYDTAVKDIQKMIDMGYFDNCYIDAGGRKLVDLDKQKQNDSNINSVRIIKCSNCGANNRVNINAVAECEYCGSPLV